MERGHIKGLPNFLGTPIISGTSKATEFKFGGYIYWTYPNKSPLKILEKRERERLGVSRDCPIFLGTPIISGTDKRTSNYVQTFIGSFRTKAYEKCWE